MGLIEASHVDVGPFFSVLGFWAFGNCCGHVEGQPCIPMGDTASSFFCRVINASPCKDFQHV